MGILSSFFDVVAGVSILAGRSSLLDTNLTTIAGRNFTVRGALGLSFLSVGFINLWATSRKQKKIERLTKDAEDFEAPAAVMRTYKGRKSPALSAKSVKVGTRKRGNDGKMWQVRSVKSRGKRTQRWFKD